MRYIIMVFLILSMSFANKCENRLFTFHNEGNVIPLEQMLKSLVIDGCGLNIVYQDDIAKSKLKQLKLQKVSVDNYTLKQFLDLLLSANNLFYNIKGDNLYISYLKTKTYNLDYIPSIRTGSSTFQGSSSQNTGDVNTVDTKYEFNFWDKLSADLSSILNTEDTYKAKAPIIDKNAGLITVTGTKRQLERVGKYIKDLNKRLHKQILIDVKIYAVDLSKNNQTGINWSKLSFSLADSSLPIRGRNIMGSQSVFNNAVFNVGGLLNFLATQGNVNSISNPKIAALNNQKALISVGDTINYRYPTKVVLDSNGNPQTEYAIGSKFVGILLDITPEISNNGEIILRINPTISDFRDPTQLSNPNRQLAPDTTDNKLSTVVRMKDGETLVLGGLITKKSSFTENGVPVLKEIPVIKYLFSSKSKISQRRELVFVVTPHIINLNKKRTLQDLGF